MSHCSNRHTSKQDGVWRLGEHAAVGIMTDLAGDVTWRTQCVKCGVLSDPIPSKIASKWGVPSFEKTMKSRSVLGMNREIMPEGWYTFEVTAGEPVKVKRGKNEGKPMYKLTLTVTEGQYTGRALNKWVCLFKPAWISYKQIVKALDWEHTKDENGEPVPVPVKKIVGQRLKGSVKHEPGFKDDGMVAAIDSFTGAGKSTENKGKIRISI